MSVLGSLEEVWQRMVYTEIFKVTLQIKRRGERNSEGKPKEELLISESSKASEF